MKKTQVRLLTHTHTHVRRHRIDVQVDEEEDEEFFFCFLIQMISQDLTTRIVSVVELIPIDICGLFLPFLSKKIHFDYYYYYYYYFDFDNSLDDYYDWVDLHVENADLYCSHEKMTSNVHDY